MSEEREEVRLHMSTIAGGEFASEFNRRLRDAIEDCADEERVDLAREIIAKVKITPDGSGYYTITTAIELKLPVLQRKSSAYENTDGEVITKRAKDPVQTTIQLRVANTTNHKD